ncbi:MAG: hypothetical protein ACRD0M_04320, partial [Acidimicrobiales bacterium]
MVGFVCRRLLAVVPVAWVTLSLLFVIFFLVPGDPVQNLAGDARVVPAAVRAGIERELGLDRPWYEQYGRYWARLATGDLGRSQRNDEPVADVVARTAPPSLRLAFWAVAIELVVGMAVGVAAAARRGRLPDTVATVLTTVVVAIPAFVLGSLMHLVLGVMAFQRGWPAWARFPVQGSPDAWVLGVFPAGSRWKTLVLPAVTLAAASGAVLA